MSSSEAKKSKLGKARLVAAWEWFKEAAWLQVLLIIAVVVGLVVSIPYIVRGITDAVNNNSSTFYNQHRITYDQLNSYLDGTTTERNVNGYIGDNTLTDDNKINFNNGKEGFVVLFYKSNCSECETLQENLEDWYEDFNKNYGEGKIKLYTLDISWDTDDEDKTPNVEGDINQYNNEYITIEQQDDVRLAIKDVYNGQDDVHKSSSVTEETLNTSLLGDKTAGTLPTPCFVTFSKSTEAANYVTDDAGYQADETKENVIQYTTPEKVIFGNLNGLALSSAPNVASQMMDIYQIKEYKGN